ncbi:MAG: SirB2 family protein [Candidatus Didemnitutus sp.]|nr:SirB2 family protein [Candidatus Didemnitutus sp.]
MERLPYYQLLHILSLIVLIAHTFMAFANPAPENRRRTMIITGIAALLMFISGFGMLTLTKIPFQTGWVIVKLVCLIGVSALAGMAFRKVHLRNALSTIAMALLAVAVFMVYFRPF